MKKNQKNHFSHLDQNPSKVYITKHQATSYLLTNADVI